MASLPSFSAERSLGSSFGESYMAPARSAREWSSSVVAQQELTFDPNTLTVTFCLPCWWGRRRCCGYTHGGDLVCWSGPC
jgi:hypothetical protein